MQGDEDPATTPTVEAEDGDRVTGPGRTTVAAAATTPLGAAGAAAAALPDSAGRLASGTRLGRYVVREVVGAGGMGEVYAAYDPELDRKVALKLLHRDLGAQAADRLRREARTMARLSHRNLVAVHDVGEHAGRLFLAMELFDGTTLRAWVRGRPWREVLRVYLDAGRGLAAAHDAGVVHRDFKPDNVLVGKDGRVAVTDFGIARRRDGHGDDHQAGGTAALADVALTRTGAMIGTPLYMSPEQLEGEAADARSDQFALAVALWEALYGDHPLVRRGADLEALRASMRGGDTLAVPASKVPARVGRALVRALRPDPAARWPSLAVLLEQLDVLRPRTLRVAIAIGGAVAIAGITAGVAYGTQAARHDPGAVCGGGEAVLATVWSPARQATLRDAMLATELPFAEAAWRGVASQVDRWGGAWVAARTRSCRATAVFHEQPPEVAEQRQACFNRQLAVLDATLGQLGRPDARVVESAQNAFRGIEDPARCETTAVRTLVDPVLAPAAAALARGAEQVTAEADATVRLGRYASARALSSIAIALAEAAGAPRLRGKAHQLHGMALSNLGNSKTAIVHFELAIRIFDEVGDDVARGEAIYNLSMRHYFLEDYPTSLRFLDDARAVARRLGDPADLVAAVHGQRGAVEVELGHHDVAIAEGQSAIAILERRRRPDDVTLAAEIARLGVTLAAARKPAEAEAHYRRAIAIVEAVHGPEHPLVAKLLGNLGGVMITQQRQADAVPILERGLRIRAGVLGAENPALGVNHQNLGAALRQLGRLDEAEPHFIKALALMRANPELDYVLNGPLSGLAHVRVGRGRDAEAVPLYEEILARHAAKKTDRSQGSAEIRFRLARVLWRLGEDRVRARALARESRAIYAGIPDMPKTVVEIDAWLVDPDTAVITLFP